MAHPTLSERQALLVRELYRTPGERVPWVLLAEAIDAPISKIGQHRVGAMVQNIRQKFGHHAIRNDFTRGYYVEPEEVAS